MNKNKNTQNNLIEAEQKIILQQKLTKDKKLQQEQTETKNLQQQLTKKIKTYSKSEQKNSRRNDPSLKQKSK